MANEMIKHEGYTEQQVQLIKSQIAPKANKDELSYFLQQCARTQLDPFSRQIYAIHRWNGQQKKEVMTIQVSIDGFRVIAERSGNYAGQGEPEYIEKDNKLDCCKVRVYKFSPRGDRYEAAVGVAYWNEYVQAKDGQATGLWAKMPRVMLAKVAEALALRKAFPQDLSGLYTSEEMNQADAAPVTVDTVAVVVEVPTYDEKCLLINLLNDSTLEQGTEAYQNALNSITGCESYKQYEKIQHRLESLQKEPVNPSQKDINKQLKAVQS
jgi:phage recombination protein Bet